MPDTKRRFHRPQSFPQFHRAHNCYSASPAHPNALPCADGTISPPTSGETTGTPEPTLVPIFGTMRTAAVLTPSLKAGLSERDHPGSHAQKTSPDTLPTIDLQIQADLVHFLADGGHPRDTPDHSASRSSRRLS